MACYAAKHHRAFGWPTAPSRRTLARRFEGLSAVVFRLMPLVAQAARSLESRLYRFRWAFIDKSVFRAKSAYHGWRYGYGLHLVCNAHRFPLACSVTTAAAKDTTQMVPLLSGLVHSLGMVVADAGYVALRLLEKLSRCWGLFVLLPAHFKGKDQWQQEYNLLADTPQARLLYRQRKATVEPVFALIKVLPVGGESAALPRPEKGQSLPDDGRLHRPTNDVLQLQKQLPSGNHPILFQ